ncbi:MAG TPA: isoprenylcysteine carboxylmethyltransferase family protein [Chloroflexota bacterium]|nr:isoprenylcysteine carboxylmethyltransferase family protein [Chloroflexota bacterium]
MAHSLITAERWSQRFGLGAVLGTLTVVLWGVWRGMRRPSGRKTGREPHLFRTPAFYLFTVLGYFGLCYRLWRPLPLALSRPVRALAVVFGSLLYFPGLVLLMWGRLTLGPMYNVSSSLGVQLYADHRLITHGPFAYVRHPMYLGLWFVGVGGLLLYRTWTFVFLLLQLPAMFARAWREEQALAAEFGSQWQIYCQQTPAWLPHVFKKHNE